LAGMMNQSGEAMLSNKQINLVRQSFASLAPRADQFGVDFYKALFSLRPALRLLFTDDPELQRKKLVEMLGAAAGMLDEPERLVPVLEASGRRHALYGVSERYYEPVGAALLKALDSALGAEFDAETAAAWSRLFDLMSKTMIRGARSLQNDAADTFIPFGH
jgi:nitric oxide dioxygenase